MKKALTGLFLLCSASALADTNFIEFECPAGVLVSIAKGLEGAPSDADGLMTDSRKHADDHASPMAMYRLAADNKIKKHCPGPGRVYQIKSLSGKEQSFYLAIPRGAFSDEKGDKVTMTIVDFDDESATDLKPQRHSFECTVTASITIE